MEEVINIKGLHCESCVKLIEGKLKSVKGVEKIKVSLIENKAFVKFNPKMISIERIKGEITDLGYSAGGKIKKGKKTVLQGIAYGLIPHIGCIVFIVGSVLGVTVLTQSFKPLLMNPFFFHILIVISIGFATLSSAIYLRKNGLLSMAGAKRKWKYLSTMYGSTVGINLVLFMLIFPLLANVSLASPATGAFATSSSEGSFIILGVDIPCPGHAPLISGELKTIEGIQSIQFSFPNNFEVMYDPSKTDKQEILALEVFKTYKATVVSEDINQASPQTPGITTATSGGCGCGVTTCGDIGSCCSI